MFSSVILSNELKKEEEKYVKSQDVFFLTKILAYIEFWIACLYEKL